MVQVGDVAPAFVARPVFGLEFEVPPPEGGRPVVLCFVRHFASPFAREAMARIQARYPDFDRAGVPLLVITRTGLTEARDFVPRHHVLAPVMVDPDGELHNRYGVGQDRLLRGTLRSAADPTVLRAAMEAVQHGHGRPHPLVTQLPAQFVVAPGGRVAHAHLGRGIFEQPDLDALLECACAL